MNIPSWLKKLPKAELHLHIEGTLEPEMMLAFAQRNHVVLPYRSLEEIQKAYHFSCLQDFLDLYYQGSKVLLTQQDFFELTYAYLKRAHEDGVCHVEIFFDPQTHTSRGVSFETVLNGIHGALEQGKKEFSISSYLILCFLRHLSEEEALVTLEQALPHKDKIRGVGLDSSELGNPPSKFKRVFARAKEEGFALVAHAGEEGPASYIWEALNTLHVSRIDHGVRCIEDDVLLKKLATEQIPLTVCPLSNVKLKVFSALKEHNLKKLLNAGLCVTINSDDPSYFGGYLLDNFVQCQKECDLSMTELKQLAQNSFQASFLSPFEKDHYSALIAKS